MGTISEVCNDFKKAMGIIFFQFVFNIKAGGDLNTKEENKSDLAAKSNPGEVLSFVFHETLNIIFIFDYLA
jgi:hypothetical protein